MKNLNKIKKTLALFLISFASFNILNACQTPQTLELKNHGKQFVPKIIEVAKNVYVASGYDASNVTMIVGEDGVVLIDAGKTPVITKRIAKDFKKITSKPIMGVIFTHAHGDHTHGVVSFDIDKNAQIWGAENFAMENDFPKKAGFKNPRSHKQSGLELPPEKRINNGVAPVVYPNGKYEKNRKIGNLYAPISKSFLTHLLAQEQKQINIAGIDLVLTRADGETPDHILIYYPKEKVIFTGDMIYKSFPNLYPIRGTHYRDVNNWIAALKTIKSFDASVMVMGHTRPVVGKEEVEDILSAYIKGVEFVFKKTIKGMNKGLTPNELVEEVKLPKELENHPYLREYYGRVDWAVRNIFNGYLGWFDGNPTNLRPLTNVQEATEFANLLGGEKQLYEIAKKALDDKKYQWTCQFTDKLIALNPENKDYKNLKASALESLSNHTITATLRNYYLTEAQELRAK